MAGIKVTGLDNLEKRLKGTANMNDVKRVVMSNGAELQRKMQRQADFSKGYQTGTTKRSIGLEIKDNGFTASVGPETEYSQYLEYGTRFMDAQPFVKPALDDQEQQFLSDIKKILK